MASSPYCKPVESGASLRRSARKGKAPVVYAEVTSDADESCTPGKKPKKRRPRVVTLDKLEKKKTPICTPGTSDSSEKQRSAFYRVKIDENGNRVFNKSLIKYFMTCDTPEADDLKHKRFNTSFLKETPRDKSDLKIFSEEEDKDPKWLTPDPKCSKLPRLNFDMPDVPGKEYVKVMRALPMDGDWSDFDKLKEMKKRLKKRNKSNKSLKRRKSPIGYRGIPLPDYALGTDYINSLNFSPPSSVEKTSYPKETEMKKEISKTAAGKKKEKSKTVSFVKRTVKKKNNKASPGTRENSSILHSLLSAPLEGPIKPPNCNRLQHICKTNLSQSLEDEMLLKKYKHLLGSKRACVVLTKLPPALEFHGLSNKNINVKSKSDGKKKVSKIKHNLGKKVKALKVVLPKPQKKSQSKIKL